MIDGSIGSSSCSWSVCKGQDRCSNALAPWELEEISSSPSHASRTCDHTGQTQWGKAKSWAGSAVTELACWRIEGTSHYCLGTNWTWGSCRGKWDLLCHPQGFGAINPWLPSQCWTKPYISTQRIEAVNSEPLRLLCQALFSKLVASLASMPDGASLLW